MCRITIQPPSHRKGDVVIDPLVPRATNRSARPTHGPVNVCLYKYTNRAADVLPAYVDKDVALYQTQT